MYLCIYSLYLCPARSNCLFAVAETLPWLCTVFHYMFCSCLFMSVMQCIIGKVCKLNQLFTISWKYIRPKNRQRTKLCVLLFNRPFNTAANYRRIFLLPIIYDIKRYKTRLRRRRLTSSESLR